MDSHRSRERQSSQHGAAKRLVSVNALHSGQSCSQGGGRGWCFDPFFPGPLPSTYVAQQTHLRSQTAMAWSGASIIEIDVGFAVRAESPARPSFESQRWKARLDVRPRRSGASRRVAPLYSRGARFQKRGASGWFDKQPAFDAGPRTVHPFINVRGVDRKVRECERVTGIHMRGYKI